MSTEVQSTPVTTFVGKQYIVATPDTCHGRPRIEGSRVRVLDVVLLFEDQKLSVDEIMLGYPDITLSQVYAALSYYYDHEAEIKKQIAEDDKTDAELRKSKGISPLVNKYQQRRS